MAVALALGAQLRASPRQTLLDLSNLLQRLFADRQWLDEHADVAQRRRHDVHEGLVVDDHFRHEAVLFLDAALAKVARVAKVLALATTAHADLVRAGTSHHRDDEIARTHPGH